MLINFQYFVSVSKRLNGIQFYVASVNTKQACQFPANLLALIASKMYVHKQLIDYHQHKLNTI